MKFLNIILACSICIASCKKTEQHDHPEPEAVNITIDAPLEHSEYEKGDTVWMNVRITAPSNLHGYEMQLLRLEDSVEVFSADEDVHSKSFSVNKYWVNDGTVHSDMELEVTAHIDHSGNKASRKVKFHCHDE